MGVTWQFLGATTVTVDGRTVPLSPPAERLIAALVVDAPRPVPATRLADRLWPHPGDGGTGGALRVRVRRLRAAFGAGSICTVGSGYAFDQPRTDVDLWSFADLVARAEDVGVPLFARLAAIERAVRIWRGPPFDCVRDEPWAAGFIDGVEHLWLTAGELWGQLKVLAGQHESALSHLRQLVDEQPLREQRWAVLMEALARADRRAEALEEFERAQRALHRELGILPGRRLVELAKRIAAGDDDLCRPHPELFEATPPPAPVKLEGVDDVIERCVTLLSRGNAVVLVGPAGSGKSRIAASVAARVDHPVVYADVSDLIADADVPGALARALHLQAEDTAEATMHRVADHLGERRVTLLVDGCTAVVDGVRAAFERFAAACAGVTLLVTARRPLDLAGVAEVRVPMLPLGDAQRPGPAALVFAEHAGIPVTQIATRWPEAVAMHHRTSGLPLAVAMLGGAVGSADDRDPPNDEEVDADDVVRVAAADALRTLPRSAQRLLGLVALLPAGVAVGQGAAIAERPEDEVEYFLRVSRSIGMSTVVVPAPGERSLPIHRFSGVVREHLIATVDDGARAAAWRRAADGFVSRFVAMRPTPIGPLDRASALAVDAQRANVLGALEQELDAARSIDLVTGLATCWSGLGRTAEATQLLQRWRPLAGQVDARREARFLTALASANPTFASRAAHLADLERARELARAAGDRTLEQRVLTELAMGLGWRGDLAGAAAILDELRPEASAADPWTRLRFASLDCLLRALLGDVAGAARELEHLADLSDDAGDVESALMNWYLAATLRRRLGDLDGAESVLRRASERPPSITDGYSWAGLAYELAAVARERRRPDAVALLQSAVGLLDRFGAGHTAAVARRDLGIMLVEQGDVEVGAHHLRRSLPMLLRGGGSSVAAALVHLGRVARRRARHEQANDLDAAALARWDTSAGAPASVDEREVVALLVDVDSRAVDAARTWDDETLLALARAATAV